MIFQAVVSNKAHPEYGQATIPFPIPNSDYDNTIELLEGVAIGSPTDQDCRVDELNSGYPILNRLVIQSVNVDELDYLAKRLESFCASESSQFQAMACKLGLADIKDLINLTFCCQQATVITDFSNLDKIGKEHRMNLNGGAMPAEKYDSLDGRNVALDLILNSAGAITPYGVVYDNGMKLAQIYNGRHLPEYYYEPCVATVTLTRIGQPNEREILYLPCADSKISRAIQRLGAGYPGQCRAELDPGNLCEAVRELFEDEFELNEHLDTLNCLARCYQRFQNGDMEKYHSVFDTAWPQTPEEALFLAENLHDFTVADGISTAEEYGQIIADAMELDPELAKYLDIRHLGQHRIDEEGGILGERGYVAYKGSQAEVKEILGRHILPAQEPQMGGLAQ
ncbi:MAG: hypothetical protein HDT35_08845 [Clostridiales bacterium]|nr:hypothetical protein [Clostridiales bacterium]